MSGGRESTTSSEVSPQPTVDRNERKDAPYCWPFGSGGWREEGCVSKVHSSQGPGRINPRLHRWWWGAQWLHLRQLFLPVSFCLSLIAASWDYIPDKISTYKSLFKALLSENPDKNTSKSLQAQSSFTENFKHSVNSYFSNQINILEHRKEWKIVQFI